jgi:hypothetical protein
MSENAGFQVILIEAREDAPLPLLLVPALRRILLNLSAAAQINATVSRALRVLKSFAGSFKAKFSMSDQLDVELGIVPEHGSADSGDLEHDLGELMVAVAEAAKARGIVLCILIDELQYLSETEMSALIMALHQISQRRLPLILFAAGLPLILGLAGRAKSYAERLFSFPRVGVLNRQAAVQAIMRPLEALGVGILPDAIDALLETTGRYPYFLQQWGYETWNVAMDSPISLDDVQMATVRAIRQLDESFFRVRFDRLTKREKDFLFAMVTVGGETQRSGDIADRLKVKPTSIGPLRSSLITKGMIYSPSHGDNAFTVPLFDGFLRRQLDR